MKSFLIVVSYMCIWTTPLQLFFITWGLVIIFNSELTILSLTNEIFLSTQLPWLYSLAKSIWYFIFPTAFASWIFALPFVIHMFLKAFFSTWFGLWLLPFAKKMP